MNTPEQIGEYLQQLRKLNGVTQADLAEKVGLKPATIAHFEGGRTNMTLATLNKMAEALGYELNVSFNLKKNI